MLIDADQWNTLWVQGCPSRRAETAERERGGKPWTCNICPQLFFFGTWVSKVSDLTIVGHINMRIFWHIGGRHGDNLWMEDMSHWCSFEILFWRLSPGMPVRGEREAEECASWAALPLIEALPWANLSYLPATDALPRATGQLIPVLVAVIQPLCLLPINHSTASSKCQAASLELEINLPPQQICQT